MTTYHPTVLEHARKTGKPPGTVHEHVQRIASKIFGQHHAPEVKYQLALRFLKPRKDGAKNG